MCTNYRPGGRDYRKVFGAPDPDFDFPAEAYPGYAAPMIRRNRDGDRETIAARFGLIPFWSKDASIARRTYNARSETVAEKPSYRTAWRQAQFCLVPMDWFYEPNYESGKAVRWKIELADHSPFAVAGIWDRWTDKETGEIVHSFSMLTVNADGHPVMQRMHKPGDEKRAIVIVEPEEYDAWLSAPPEQAANFMRRPSELEIVTEAAPR